MTMWLVNPHRGQKGKRRVAKKRKRRRLGAKARAAALRNLKKARAARRKKANPTRTRRRRQRRTPVVRKFARRNPVAKRKRRRRRSNVGANPKRRRRYRRNPAFTIGGITKQLQQGVMDAGAVVLGKAAARALPQMVGLNATGPAGLAVQGLAAVVAGYAASRFLGANVGRLVLAGALAAPVESFIKSLNIPILSPALGEEFDAYPGLDVGSYPQLTGVGEEEYLEGY